MSVTSDTVRTMFKQGDDVRDAGLTTPADVARVDDLVYATDDPCQKLDVYRPHGSADVALPVIVSVHGGGWVYGDKERYQWYCMSLAQRGFAVVNFTYRLAPEHQFPASMVDTCAVFSWVLDHAHEHGFDLDHVFAVGDSAGAHMLSMFCAACNDPAYARELGICPPADFVPAGVALNCGAYRIEVSAEKHDDPMLDLTSNLMADLLPGGGGDSTGVRAHIAAVAPYQRVPARICDDRRRRLFAAGRVAAGAGPNQPGRRGVLSLLSQRRPHAWARVPLQHETRRGRPLQRRRVRLLPRIDVARLPPLAQQGMSLPHCANGGKAATRLTPWRCPWR